MTKFSEKELDLTLEDALRHRPAFVEWFLNRTVFAGRGASYYWSRANHPWGTASIDGINTQTGEPEMLERGGETDILAVFKTPDGKRVALHIENKRASGRFTKFQPRAYAARAAAWKGKQEYGNYEEWQTVLLAPNAFLLRFPTEAGEFGTSIAYEEIAAHLPPFGASL